MGSKEEKTPQPLEKIPGWSRNKNTLDKRIPTGSKVQGRKGKIGLILALPVPELMWVSCGGRRAWILKYLRRGGPAWQSQHCGSFGPGCNLLAKCCWAK